MGRLDKLFWVDQEKLKSISKRFEEELEEGTWIYGSLSAVLMHTVSFLKLFRCYRPNIYPVSDQCICVSR